MLLLSNKFQTIRIIPGGNFNATIDGPDIDSVRVLEPKLTTALDLKPRTTWITGPDDELKPDIDTVKDLKPNISRAKNLKPTPK